MGGGGEIPGNLQRLSEELRKITGKVARTEESGR